MTVYILEFCIMVVLIFLIVLTLFHYKFRSDDAMYCKEKKRIAVYTKDRRDIEEKICSLQAQINNSGVRNWFDNNQLPISVQNGYVRGLDEQSLFYEEVKNNFGITENVSINPGLVFMIMPFNNEATKAYLSCKAAVESEGLELKKSDDEYVAQDLLRYIIKLILSSQYIIANLDGKNPNVFYELGIAHALGKRTILISSSSVSDIPFNISNRNIIFYKDVDDLADKIKRVIRSFVNE